jgi:hypothetical protein
MFVILLVDTDTSKAGGEAQQTALPGRDWRQHAPIANGEWTLIINKHRQRARHLLHCSHIRDRATQ